MSGEQLELKFSVDSADAVAGVKAVETALEGVKGSTDQAAQGLKKVETASTELVGTLKDKLGPATQAAFDAFQKMSTAETPRALQRSIIDSENAMQRFRTAIDSARASGEKIPTSITNGLKTMQAEVDGSYKKLGQMRDQMGDVKTKADAMGQGWSQAASSGGSLDSMLNNLEASSRGVGQSFARTALASAGAVAAFKVGFDIGKQLVAGMKDLGYNIEMTSKAWSNLAVGAAQLAGDTRLGKWFRDLADSTRNYSEFLTPLSGKVNKTIKDHQQLQKEISATDAALKKLSIEWHTSNEAADKFGDIAKKISERMQEAYRAGELFEGILKANGASFDALQKAVDDGSVKWNSLNKEVQYALIAHRQLNTEAVALTGGIQSLTAANAAYEQQLKDNAATEKEYADDLEAISDRNAKARREEAKAAREQADAFGLVAKGLTAISAQADMAQAGLEGVAWAMRKATPATFELNDAQKDLIESLAKVSDQGGASSLWVGHLIAQLEAGEISFDAFTQKVNQLLRELTVIGPVMGNTADELNKINTLLSSFKDGAGQGWPTPVGP